MTRRMGVMDGTICNRVTFMSMMSVIPTMSVKKDWHANIGQVIEEIRALMRERTGLGNWNARIGLYGAPAFMEVQQQQILDAIAHIGGARLESCEYPGEAKAADVLPRDQAVAGTPNMDLLNFHNWYGWEHTGQVAYAPIMPLTGEDG